MRLKDWADRIAEKFYDTIIEEDDNEIVDRIAGALRSAYLDGLKDVPVTIRREEKHGKTNRYQVSVPVDTDSVPDAEYVRKHGKFTWLEDEKPPKSGEVPSG